MTTIDPIPSTLKQKFWLVSADMGYGHQRAIFPLKDLSQGGVILNANISPNAKPQERRKWKILLRSYEYISRVSQYPIFGNLILRLFDILFFIPKYYPFKDRSKPTFQVKWLKSSIKGGLCNGILTQIKNPELPLITSFYSAAIAAEMAGHNSIYCIVCDTDINRVWVAENASTSRIIYFAPDSISVQRLLSYGVPAKNIILTGFPLPFELLGNRDLNILKANLKRRLKNLDPEGEFYNLYKHSVNAFLQYPDNSDLQSKILNRPITITYTVGGAGAQKEIGKQIAKSLAGVLHENRVKLNLVAGIRPEIRDYFLKVKKEHLNNSDNVQIIWRKDIETYFQVFNECLHTTDILWTKPGELSFYCALGIPIIITPAIGPHEKRNRKWLREIGAGIKQRNPDYTNEWLFDLLKKGRLAEAAWNGLLKARKYGAYNIIDFLNSQIFITSSDPLKR